MRSAPHKRLFSAIVLINATVSAGILGCLEAALDRSPPEPAERLTMPAEEGIGLHNEKRLFPVPDGSREYDQKQPIGPGTCWALHLTAEDDQLLAQQRVFGNEFCPGAG